MNSKASPFLNKSHNFGIFLKKGKRGILQLDFPSQMILMIQRGHIKKTQQFHSLLYFESEEDLHITLRFLDSDLDFDADTPEEKYTICRLLDLILEAENAEPPAFVAGSVSVVPDVPIVPHNVLKDGVLEKKGNTTITTWNRRRVKISAGEFSYFKPGEELELNVVQLRQDRCRLARVGQNTINLTVGQRTYCFRVPNESRSGLSVEAVRDDWIKAFDQAMTMRRAIIFSTSSSPPPSDCEASLPDSEPSDVSSISSSSNSPFINRKDLDTVSNNSNTSDTAGNQEITASVSVRFSYSQQATTTTNDTTTTTATFVNASQPKPAKRPTVYPFRRRKDKGTDRFGDVVSRPHPDSLSDDLPVTALRAKFTAHSFFDRGPRNVFNFHKSASMRESKAKALNDRVLAFSDLSLGENDPKVIGRRDLEVLSEESSQQQLQPQNCANKERKSIFELWDERTTAKEGKSAGGERNTPSGGKALMGVGKSFRDDTVFETVKHSGGLGGFGGGGKGRVPGGGQQVGNGGLGGGGLVKASSMSDLLDIDEDKETAAVARPSNPRPLPHLPPRLPPPSPLLPHAEVG